MQTFRRRLISAVLLFSLLTPVTPAFAANKDMIQLQTQVQQLLDAVARLQQSNDERMGVLKDLVQQSSDSVNRMSVTVDALQKQVAAQQAATGTKVDGVSGQVQALNDSLDEIRARMVRLEKAVNDVQGSQQNISASLQNLPQGTGSSAQPASASPVQSAPMQSAVPPSASNDIPAAPISRPAGVTRTPLAGATRAAANGAPPVLDLYKSAYGDYMAAKYPIASSEFNDVIKSYPEDTLAGNAYYYLGEIDYRAGKYAAAARSYDKVLEDFPDNNKVPAAHLHKGQALIEAKQTDAGIRELRALIQRFPSSPEATQARSRLNGYGRAGQAKKLSASCACRRVLFRPRRVRQP